MVSHKKAVHKIEGESKKFGMDPAWAAKITKLRMQSIEMGLNWQLAYSPVSSKRVGWKILQNELKEQGQINVFSGNSVKLEISLETH